MTHTHLLLFVTLAIAAVLPLLLDTDTTPDSSGLPLAVTGSSWQPLLLTGDTSPDLSRLFLAGTGSTQ